MDEWKDAIVVNKKLTLVMVPLIFVPCYINWPVLKNIPGSLVIVFT